MARPPWSYSRDQLPLMVTRARLKVDSGMVLYIMGALKVFTSGGPGLRHTSVGKEVAGLKLNEVRSDDGAGSLASNRDQGRWDVDAIVDAGSRLLESKRSTVSG